jgi:hypothetical protein
MAFIYISGSISCNDSKYIIMPDLNSIFHFSSVSRSLERTGKQCWINHWPTLDTTLDRKRLDNGADQHIRCGIFSDTVAAILNRQF